MTPRVALVLAGVLMLAGCKGEEHRPPDSVKAVTVAPAPTPAPAAVAPGPPYSTVAVIDARVDSIEKYLEREPARLKLYATITEDDEELTPVRDSTKWPKHVESSFNLFTDSTNHLVLYREVPQSGSGDWYAVMTHYFAPDGQTIFYKYEVTSFSSGCTDVLRESIRTYLQPGGGVIKEVRGYTDKDGKAIVADRCERRSDDAYLPQRSASELLLPPPGH